MRYLQPALHILLSFHQFQHQCHIRSMSFRPMFLFLKTVIMPFVWTARRVLYCALRLTTYPIKDGKIFVQMMGEFKLLGKNPY